MHIGFTDIPQDPSKDIVVIKEPSVLEKIKNFGGAISRIAEHGLKLVPKNIEMDRMMICDSCHYWQKNGSLGLGKCKKCGCAGIKLNLATEKCPVGSWGVYNAH